jgi:hypothetical protein
MKWVLCSPCFTHTLCMCPLELARTQQQVLRKLHCIDATYHLKSSY